MDALTTALSTSVLGTFRVFVVLLVGILSSKCPRNEREWRAVVRCRELLWRFAWLLFNCLSLIQSSDSHGLSIS